MLRNYFKIAWRNMAKNRVASIINITGLSLGMAAAVLILFWVQNELNFDTYHHNAANTYYVNIGPAPETKFGSTPFLLATTLQQQIPEIEKSTSIIAATGYNTPVLFANGQYFKEKDLAYTDANWFSIFTYDIIDGSTDNFNADPSHIILTESLAKKYFGKTGIAGHVISIDSTNYQVQAVVKDNRVNSSFQFSIFLPISLQSKNHNLQQESWSIYNCQTFIQTKEQTAIPKLQQRIGNIMQQHQAISLNTGNHTDKLFAFLTRLPKLHFEGSLFFNPGNSKTVAIFSILGFLLLTIACINYVNLSTAKASLRSKEVSIKKIVGARKKSLFTQFIIESLLTSFIALLAALVIIKLALPWFNSFTEKQFSLSLSSAAPWEVLGGTLLLAVLLTGIYPALLLSSFKPLSVLRGNNLLAIKHTSLRKILVTVQFTIAIALSVCTVVILKQLYFIQHTNEGYNRSQIFSFALPRSWAASRHATNKSDFTNVLKNELKKETPIENITVANDAIQNIVMSMAGIIDWTGRKPDNNPEVSMLSVDADFINIFKLQLKEGRWYEPGNPADRHNYILTETTVAALGLQKPYIGQYFSLMNDTGRIIGIVKDFHFRSFHSKISAAVLTNRPDMTGTFFVQSNASNMQTALVAAEKTWKSFFPTTPFEYKFMDAEFEKMYRTDRKTATLVSGFAAVAIFICCLGLFGLVSFIAEQRTKEIGIRKILGATITNIVTLLSKDFIRLVMLAIVIASPLAWWAMNKWLQDFAYKINISWWMFAVAGLSALLLALATAGFQSVKAALSNPAKSLRTE